MFKFNNISSEQMGVVVVEDDFLARASIKSNAISIEGRNGAIYYESGYNDVEIKLNMYLTQDNADDVLAWLNGSGTLEYNERYTTARFYSQVSVKRAAGLKSIEVQLIRAPFWYAPDDFETVTDRIHNAGSCASHPIIKLIGTIGSSIDMTIGGVRLEYKFNDSDTVFIDCLEQTEKDASNLSQSKNLIMGFDYPKLSVGTSEITTHSGSATVQVRRRSCFL